MYLKIRSLPTLLATLLLNLPALQAAAQEGTTETPEQGAASTTTQDAPEEKATEATEDPEKEEAEPEAAIVDCNAYAPPEDRADPQQLILRGVTCFERGEYLLAMKFYRDAHRLAPSPLFKAAIGRSFQELGLPALARAYYLSYLQEVSDDGDDEGTQKIQQRLQTVDQQLEEQGVNVRLATKPPGARAYLVIDGDHWEELGTTPLETTLVPGQYEFAFQQEDYRIRTDTLYVTQMAEHTALDVEMIREDAVFDVTNRKWKKTGAYFMFGALPLIATGGTLYGVGAIKERDARDFETSDARDSQMAEAATFKEWGIITGAVGVSALATGVILYVIGSTGPDDPSELQGWRPELGPNYAGVRADW